MNSIIFRKGQIHPWPFDCLAKWATALWLACT